MSIETVAACLPVQGLTPTTKLVLIGIANHDGDGGAWPSLNTLATYACVSVRQVQRCLRTLEDAGHITTIANGGGNLWTRDGYRPNRYLVHPVRGDTHDRGGVTWVTGEG